mmetsp:Transcript_49309/g.139606  ORF Transcript_49309/g.139606 Transcript_49309/m.139606 type:complete len:94 (+) Transcript_49309:148-429(+)
MRIASAHPTLNSSRTPHHNKPHHTSSPPPHLKFSYIGSVVGSVGATSLSFILPCLFHSTLFEVTPLQTALNVGTAAIGFVCGAVGLYTTVRSW